MFLNYIPFDNLGMARSTPRSWIVPVGIGVVVGLLLTFLVKTIFNKKDSIYERETSEIINQMVMSNISRSITSDDRIKELEEQHTALKSKLVLVEREIKKLRMSSTNIGFHGQSKTEFPVASSVRNINYAQSRGASLLSGNHLVNSTNPTPLSIRCQYDFKVYVYPIPSSIFSIRISEEARRNGTLHVCQKCILEQFALEYILYDFFTQFCGRTYDPDVADFFYLPLVRDAEFRLALQQGGIRNRAPSATEIALLNVLEKNDTKLWKSLFNITDTYWNRYGGADHIIVMPAPVTNLRHETSQRGFFHYMIHLHKPIFLGLEYSKAFIEEYPVCSTRKNIVVPYPTTDPDLFNGKLLSYSIERSALLYYAGGLHGDCVEIRKAMKQLMLNSSRLSSKRNFQSKIGDAHDQKQYMVIPKIKSIQEEREHGFLAATFCPIPVGDSPSSKRMYDVLNFGCIPVVLSDDLVWAFSDQTGGMLNHSLFAIQLPQSVVQYSIDRTLLEYSERASEFGHLPSTGISLYNILAMSRKEDEDYENGIYVNPLVRILRRIPSQDIAFLRDYGQQIASSYRYYEMNSTLKGIPTSEHVFPNGGAIQIIANELKERKLEGISRISEFCQSERLRAGHRYVARYSCNTDRKDSLLKRSRF